MIKFCGFYSFTSIITRFFTSSMLLFCNLSTKCGNGYSHRLRAITLKACFGVTSKKRRSANSKKKSGKKAKPT